MFVSDSAHAVYSLEVDKCRHLHYHTPSDSMLATLLCLDAFENVLFQMGMGVMWVSELSGLNWDCQSCRMALLLSELSGCRRGA